MGFRDAFGMLRQAARLSVRGSVELIVSTGQVLKRGAFAAKRGTKKVIRIAGRTVGRRRARRVVEVAGKAAVSAVTTVVVTAVAGPILGPIAGALVGAITDPADGGPGSDGGSSIGGHPPAPEGSRFRRYLVGWVR